MPNPTTTSPIWAQISSWRFTGVICLTSANRCTHRISNATRANLCATPVPPQHPRSGTPASHRDPNQATHYILQSGAERLAIADANNFQFTNAQIQRDIHELRRLGSLDTLIVHHNNKQKDSGLNEKTRVMTHLSVMNTFLKSWK